MGSVNHKINIPDLTEPAIHATRLGHLAYTHDTRGVNELESAVK